MISLILSSAIGILCAAGYLMLFKRSAARAFKAPGPFQLAKTVSGLFSRLILAGLVLFFISRIPSLNFLAVLLNFVVMVPVLFLWMAWGFSRQTIITNDPYTARITLNH
jgi:hypothetical protein